MCTWKNRVASAGPRLLQRSRGGPLRNAYISARVKELQDTQVERVISLEIKEQNSRIAKLQYKLELLDILIAARAEDMTELPGGATGLLCRERGGTQQLVQRYDSAVI